MKKYNRQIEVIINEHFRENSRASLKNENYGNSSVFNELKNVMLSEKQAIISGQFYRNSHLN